jgi:hypothetical protein
MRLASLLLLTAGCGLQHDAYLAIPVEATQPAGAPEACVRVAFLELERRMPDFDPNSVAFYGEGREPLRWLRLDTDRDGRTDAALVPLKLRADGKTTLIVVSPGPVTEPLTGEVREAGARLRLDLAFR